MTNIASAAMSFAGTLEATRAESNNYKYQAQVADNNAGSIDSQGEAATQAQARAFQRSLGSMTAAYGGTGIDSSMGSPLNVLTDAVRQGTLDRLTTKYNYDVAAGSQREQAKLDRLGARNAQTSGMFNALANGLSSFASGQVQSNYGQQPTASAYGGNSLMPGSQYTGIGSFSTSWAGDGTAASGTFNSLDGSGNYVGNGSSTVSWSGFGGGWG